MTGETQVGATVVTVWVVEDNDLFRQSTQRLIETAPGLRCPVAEASCEAILAQLDSRSPPDIVLMDIGLPGIDGIEGTRQLAARVPETRIIILTIHEESEKIFDAICAGASGYLLKPSPPDQIIDAICKVGQGAAPINAFIASKLLAMFTQLTVPRQDYGLSPRETEILGLLVDGKMVKQIADQLGLSYHTIDTHIRNIYSKLHVHSRSGAVAKALKEHLL